MANRIEDVVREVESANASALSDDVLISEALRYVLARLAGEAFVALLHLEDGWLASRGLVEPAGVTVGGSEELSTNSAIAGVQRFVSGRVALREALARLVANGSVIFVTGEQQLAHIPIEVMQPSGSSSNRMAIRTRGVAAIAPTDCFRLRHSVRGTSIGTALDPDVFLADLAPIRPSPELEQCIRESFGALRAGLYLGTVALLGMAAEIQLFEEAVRLAPKVPTISKALSASPPQSLTVQIRLFEELRRSRANDAAALQSQAEHMRQLRNYGVHLKANQPNPLASQVGEVPCSVLLLQLHAYLIRVHALTGQRISEIP